MNKKLLITFFITLGLLSSPLLFVSAQDTTAEDLGASTPKISAPLNNPKLSVRIPGLNFDKAVCTDKECSNNWIATYIVAIYKYGISTIGILAVITIMIGGIIWLTAGGSQQKIADAKKWIGGSLMGVLIAITSYVILNMVNPALTELSPIKLSYISSVELPEMSEAERQEEEMQISAGETVSIDNTTYAKRRRTEFIIVHTAAGIMTRDAVHADHIRNRKWKGIGYNLYIERNGQLVDGRGEDAIGAHAEGYNSKSIGISYSGCAQKYPPTNQPFNNAISGETITQNQLNVLISTIKNLQQKYNIPKDKVLGHTETPGVGKACPCINMDELRSKILP